MIPLFFRLRLATGVCSMTIGVMLILSGGRLAAATGPLAGAALQARLRERTSVLFDGNSLRDALYRLCENYRVAVLLDRRIDPDRPLRITLRNVSTVSALNGIAKESNASVAWVGSTAYFAPTEPAVSVRAVLTARESDVRSLPEKKSVKLRRVKTLAWSELSEPRKILEKIAEETSVTIENPDLIPHDLWAEAKLGQLDFVERATLIAHQFDLTFAITEEGDAIKLVPLPKDLKTAKETPAADGSPSAESQSTGAAAKIDASALAKKRFTLQVKEQPAGGVFKKLAEQIGLDLEMDQAAIEESGGSLSKRISFSVKNATVDQLFSTVAREAGLKFRRQGTKVVIEGK